MRNVSPSKVSVTVSVVVESEVLVLVSVACRPIDTMEVEREVKWMVTSGANVVVVMVCVATLSGDSVANHV